MDEDIEERRAQLGFAPQKEIVYNKLLPYADKLDEESRILFHSIKSNLVKAFLAREIRPGCALWTSRLHRYMKIYGLKFSKEDHIGLIKLYYELLTLPNLETARVNKFAGTLFFLLKKKELLSPDDLQLEWRPLYDLIETISKKGRFYLGIYNSSLDRSINQLVRAARIYFGPNATKEILEELRPKFCPYSCKDYIMNYLEMFLPVTLKPEQAEIGYKLWFDELLNFWEVCHNATCWENQIMQLLAELAANNIGYINWDPYVPSIFVRFVRTMQLPVSYKQKQTTKQFKIDVNAMTLWIVSALGGPNDTVFKHLESFMQVIETYFNAANTGRWSPKIREFLRRIALNFVNRVHDERYKKPTWATPTPDEYKLTELDIDRFVNIMKPCLEHAIFCRTQQDIMFTFNYLACLRPHIIIPIALDKLYASMDSLTEPHKLTSTLMCLTAVSRYMVQGKDFNYPEGPTHVIPLLMNLLPGIDPNDRRKSYMTFNFIVQFVNMVPLIDSSEAHKYYDDLTEEEHMICEASAGLEDFIVQFFDRLCIWIESNSFESTRMEQNDHDRRLTKSETIAESALASVISTVLTQCSPKMFTMALKKVFNFATTRIFEIKVSGRMVGALCQTFSRTNPKETAKLFIPHLCDTIDTLLGDADVMHEENLNEETLYNLLLLSDIIDCNAEIVCYIDRIMSILDKVLYMTSLQANQFGTHMFNLLMTTLTFTMPLEYRSNPVEYDTPLQDYLSIRSWGKAGNIKDLQIKWYTPGQQEIDAVQMLLNHYLVPELAKLEAYADGNLTMSRPELRRTFKIILASLGCHIALPVWQEPALNLINSVLDPWAFELTVGCHHTVTMPDGSNVRKTVADVIHKVQRKILEIDESDTKSLCSIIFIYDVLLFNKFRGRDFEFHWKNFHTIKSLLEDKLHKHKKHLRHILIDRVMLHLEFRNESRSCSFTATHQQIMLDLFELATNRYSDIRSLAQMKLNTCITQFPFSYVLLTPHLMRILQHYSEEEHEQFKGCLYILLGPKTMPLIARHDWGFVRQIWPLVVRAQTTEKHSLVNLFDNLSAVVLKYYPTVTLKLEIPDELLQIGYGLAKNYPKVDLTGFDEVIKNGANALSEKHTENCRIYDELVEELLDCANSNLHWRQHLMSVCFLRDLVHPDAHSDPKVVRFFLKALIDESLKIRKVAIKVMYIIIMQNKIKQPKLVVDPYTQAGVKSVSVIPFGDRPDNAWLMYNSQTIPKNAEEWNSTRWVHDDGIGFYHWPKELYVFDYSVCVSRDVNDLNANQKEIYEFFCDTSNVEALIRYYSMEEKKGNDKFNSYRFLFFKYLFKIFEAKLLPILLPHLSRLVEDKQEQSQRCASEIVSGLISGCKHWIYEDTVNMWTEVIPLLRKAFNNLSEENLFDWASCLGVGMDNRDPNRYNWLLEFLMDDPLSEPTSFLACARIYLIFCAVNQQPWRNAELYERCMTYIQNHLTHPFQNVRDKISVCLAHILSRDVMFAGGEPTRCPRVADFFDMVNPTLLKLASHTLQKLEKPAIANGDDNHAENVTDVGVMSDSERENAIRLFKTVGKYLRNSVAHAVYTIKAEHFALLPLACILQSNETDDELTSVCTNIIVVFSTTLVPQEHLGEAMKVVAQVAKCPFWSARAVIAEFIPIFVFYNLATLLDANHAQEILDITLELLEDVQPEVRVKASHAISGFLHVNFIKEPMALLEIFRKKAKTKLKSSKSGRNSHANIRIRHAGVLGLCCYINSRPYDVPDYLPALFEELGPHLNDPLPIPSSIRKTLGDFKRTHHVNWDLHKLKFTEDELTVLTDLAVPPSYYA